MNEYLYESIFKRKSNRKYQMTPLETEQLLEIKAFADNLKPLYENIKVEYELTSNVKNLLPIKAPHYIIISSENKEGYLANVGFLFQQMDLFLSSKGLGSCWLGMAKPTEKMETKLEFVIVMAFGKAVDSPYRARSEFKRKPLSEISSGSDDRLECARLAPSASNSQNWFFDCNNGNIHIYKKNLNPIKMLMYERMNKVDIGIVISHLYVATQHQGKEFSFTQLTSVKELKGYTYIGTVR